MSEIVDKAKIIGAIFVLVAGVAAFYVLDDSSDLIRVGLLVGSIILAAAVALMSEPGQQAWEFAKGARENSEKLYGQGARTPYRPH